MLLVFDDCVVHGTTHGFESRREPPTGKRGLEEHQSECAAHRPNLRERWPCSILLWDLLGEEPTRPMAVELDTHVATMHGSHGRGCERRERAPWRYDGLMLHDMGATRDTVLPVAATLAPRPRGGGDVRSRCVMARVTL